MTEPTLMELERLSDFYLVELEDLMTFEEGSIKFKMPETSIHGLRHEEVSEQDFKSIAEFGRIIKNYIKIKKHGMSHLVS
jgi:hypothetical protein